MKPEPLNDKTFIVFAMKSYDNPQCEDIEEFYEDINRVKYIKRLLGRFIKKGVLKERLILNHIIIMGNVFGPLATSRMLFFKLEEELYSSLKTFLLYLGYLPWPLSDEEYGVLGYLPEFPHQISETDMQDIPIDLRIMKVLKGI